MGFTVTGCDQPALTTRGMMETEMRQVASWIAEVLESRGNESVMTKVHAEVRELCEGFPVYFDEHGDDHGDGGGCDPDGGCC